MILALTLSPFLLPVVAIEAIMKRFAKSILISTVLLSVSCNSAKFGGVEKKKSNQSENIVPEQLILDVTTPSDVVRAGKESIQATATLRGKTEVPDVIWSIESAIENKGTIDDKGLYTSPEKADAKFPVTLVATLKKDPRVVGKKTISVIPVIFIACSEGSETFPIVAKVYQMNPSVKRLPDYNNPQEATYKTQVCMENYAVEPRRFEEGFPKVESLFEYFSLQTTTTLLVPVDGEYTFELNSDDGSRLFIGGNEIINNDGEHQAFGHHPEDSLKEGRKSATVYLTAGEHALALNYFQGPRYRIGLMLKWKVPGTHDLVYVPRQSFK